MRSDRSTFRASIYNAFVTRASRSRGCARFTGSRSTTRAIGLTCASVVVDGRVGYTGGFGLADYWLGDGHHEEQWRESNVRFSGPAVMELQAAFSAAWAESTGELITGPLFFPEAGFQEVGKTHAGLLYTAPTTGSTPAERFLALTISGARKTLYITNSYFVPDDDFRRLLERAVQPRRGRARADRELEDRRQDDVVRRPRSL